MEVQRDWVDYATLAVSALAAAGTVAAVWWGIVVTRRATRKNVKLKAYRAQAGVALFITNEGPRSINFQNCWLVVLPDESVIGMSRGDWPRRLEEGETEKLLVKFDWGDRTDDQVTAHVSDVAGEHWHTRVEKPSGTYSGWVIVDD